MPRRLCPLLALGACLVFSCSCQTLRFYQQAANGQWEIIRKSRPNPQIISDPATPAKVRRSLTSVEGIRRFARERLSLPGDESYGRYTDLGRDHVVWVLYAAPEFSLKPKKWRYPVIGEMDYRGYFREEDTRDLAGQLRAEGYDVYVGGVDAYSTLGWLHDPVLNTFIHYPDVDLAETIFHELSHRKYFRRGDTVFNESMANVVAEEGVRRWLKAQERLSDLRHYEGRLVKRREFYQEINVARHRLEMLYQSGKPEDTMRREKTAILLRLRDQFRELRRRWGGRGLDAWLVEDINNGHIVSLKLYAEKMPFFQNLLAKCGGDLNRFFVEVRRAKMDR